MKKQKGHSKIDYDTSLREESSQILSHLLDRVALIALTLGTLATVVSAFRASTQGWHANIIVDMVFFILIVILLILRKALPFSIVVALLFIIAGINAFLSFINLGLATVSFVMLATCCVMTGIFFGFRAGLWGLIVSILIVSAIGFFICTERLKTIPNVEAYLLSPQTWITQVAGYTVFVLIMLASIHSIQARLWQSFIELKKSTDALHEREERYRLLAENMHDVMCVLDMDFNTKYLSPSAEKLFGYTTEELLKMRLDKLLTPDSLKNALALYSFNAEKAMQGDLEGPLMEFEFVRKDGSTFWGEWKGKFLSDEQGRLIGTQGIVRDISGRKQAEAQIKKDLEEKKILLQEIHHRVKNNLNIISSLLSLQANKMEKNPVVLKAFTESRDRIHAMALVHEKLYESEDLGKIDIKSYIEIMTRELFEAYCVREDVILDLNIQNIVLDINTAIPCGMILNERFNNRDIMLTI